MVTVVRVPSPVVSVQLGLTLSRRAALSLWLDEYSTLSRP